MAQNDYVIGIGMGLDPSGLKAGLETAKQDIALAKSEFEAAAGWDKAWNNSIDGVQAKIKQLADEVEAKKTMVDLWQQELDRVTEIYGEDSAEAKQTQTKLNNAQAALNKAEGYAKSLQDRLEELQAQEEDTGEATDDLTEDIDDLGEEADDTQKGGLKKLKDSLGEIKDKVADKVKQGLANIKDKFTDLASKGIGKAVDALKDFIRGVVNVGKDFTSTMSSVKAHSRASAEEMEKLEAVAKEMGANTTFSATEAAEALDSMALAGWKADQSAAALGGVLDLAAAAQMDLGDAAQIVTKNLSAFKLEAKDAGHFADVLAYAESNSNTTAAALGEAFENVAATMGQSGQSVETTTAILMAMANAGTEGSKAGTALNAVMTDLTKKQKEGWIQIGDTAVSIKDEAGNYRDLITILYDAKKATQGLGDVEAQSALMNTFTTTSLKAVNEVFGQGVVAVGQYRNELKKSDGAAKTISDIMNDNLSGDMKMLDSAVQDIQIGIFELIEGPLRTIVQLVTAAIRGIKWLAETIYNALVILYDNSIGPIIDTLGATWDLLTGNFEGSDEFFGGVADGIKDAFEGADQFFDGVWTDITGAFSNAKTDLEKVAGNMRDGLESGWNDLTQWAGDRWSDITGAFSNAKSDFEGFAGKMREGLQYGWDEIGSWFGDRWTDIKGAFGGAKDALGKVASAMRDGLQDGWNNFASVFGTIWTGIKGAFGGAKDALSSVASAMRDGLQDGWNNFSGAFGTIWTGIKGAFSNPLDTFKDIAASMRSGLQDGWDSIKKPFENIWNAIKSPFEGIGKWFTDNVINPIKKAFGPLLKFFGLGGDDEDESDPNADLKKRIENAKKILRSYENSRDAYKERYYATYDMGDYRNWQDYEGYVRTQAATVASLEAELEAAVAKEASKGLGGIGNAIIKPFQDAYDTITGIFGGIGNWFSENVTSPISNALGGAIGVGGDLVGGIVNGIVETGGAVASALGDAASGAVSWVQDLLGIHSPSTVMRDEVGKMIGAGMAEGIRDSIGTVERASEELSEAVSISGSAAAGGSAGGGTVVFNQTINSPDPLSAGQIYRDTRSLLGRRGWAA